MSLSGQIAASLDKKVEEAWLLWKLGRKHQAIALLKPLLKRYPDNPDVLRLGTTVYIEKGRLKRAAELTKELERILGNTKYVKEFKAKICIQKGKWVKARKIYEELLKEEPNNSDYQRDYAELLTLLKKWPEAERFYAYLISQGMKTREIVWNYRKAKEEGCVSADGIFTYVHAPESLRQYQISETLKMWVHPMVRVSLIGIEEFYRKRPLDTLGPIKEAVFGHTIKTEWFLNGLATISGHWQLLYNDGNAFHEFNCEGRIDRPNFHSIFGYQYNHFVRDPIESFDKTGRRDRFYVSSNILLFGRLLIGDTFDIRWYRVTPDANPINGKGFLGQKMANEAFANIIIVPNPYFTFNMRHRYARWEKPFEEAEQVLDFISEENVYSLGLYLEDEIWKIAKVSGSFTRSYDSEGEYYSSLTTCAVEVWLSESFKVKFSYEYDKNVANVLGTGDVQVFKAEGKAVF